MTSTFSHRLVRGYIGTLLLGIGLHFLFQTVPCLLTAALSPVNESIWEHLKLVFYPVLAFALLYTRKERAARGGWYAALLAGCALLLGFGWGYHVLLGGTALALDIAAYALILAACFCLGTRWSRKVQRRASLRLICLVLLAAILIFTFVPPGGRLFADPALVDAFYSLPC